MPYLRVLLHHRQEAPILPVNCRFAAQARPREIIVAG
jgi:hypothetical protein